MLYSFVNHDVQTNQTFTIMTVLYMIMKHTFSVE